MSHPPIQIPVDLTNPGQFFACCGLLELASRLWPGAEGWFDNDFFFILSVDSQKFDELIQDGFNFRVLNTMTPAQNSRLEMLSQMRKSDREREPNLEAEKKALEALRREEPIVLEGACQFRIDWFKDDSTGGTRFKTWAGQQSVLNITQAMQEGMKSIPELSSISLWSYTDGTGLPFNFDSDLGGQGSALDIGFSFDPLAASDFTRIEGNCKPSLELLCFIGLQRFRPREIKGENRFVYTAWSVPTAPVIASAFACQAIQLSPSSSYEFRLLYRTKYLKSFLPAQPYQGDTDE